VQPDIRLLALDIDGTLLNSRFVIGEPDLVALRRAHASGVQIMLCTGRRHTFAMPIAKQLGFELWLCTSNGAVTRSSKGETFHREFLPADLCRELCAHMIDFRGGTVLTFDKDVRGALVIERDDEMRAAVGRWLDHNAPYIEYISPIEKALTEDPLQAMICGTVERVNQAEKRLAEFPQIAKLSVLKTQYDHRNLSMVDMLPLGVTKGHALARWASAYGIAKEQIMAVGDNFNDVEMLEAAGHPFIMGNACDELKQNGWRLTLSNDECGVAAALEQMLGASN
jgi:Cof subfamily protein (haloacid dehalogenase superfamily)